jgi:hypothetical protein
MSYVLAASITTSSVFIVWFCTLIISIIWYLLQSNVNALIDMKLEKYKNFREESAFFWGEISKGILKFDRKEAEVCAL